MASDDDAPQRTVYSLVLIVLPPTLVVTGAIDLLPGLRLPAVLDFAGPWTAATLHLAAAGVHTAFTIAHACLALTDGRAGLGRMPPGLREREKKTEETLLNRRSQWLN